MGQPVKNGTRYEKCTLAGIWDWKLRVAYRNPLIPTNGVTVKLKDSMAFNL